MKTQMLIDLGFDCFWRITWQASFLIGLILLIHWLLRDRLSARWRFTFWWLILIRLMLPVMPESAWSIFNIARKNASENLAVTPASEIIPNFTITHSIPLKPDVSEWAGDENALDDDSAVTDSSALPAMKPLNWYQSKSFQLAVAGVWLLGVLLYGGRIVIGSIWFKYRLAHRDPIDNPELSKISEECRKTLGLKRPLVIIETPEVDCPALFGLFRPKIVVPHHFLRYSSEEWRHILLHESAHIRRNDVLLTCLLAVLQALHWFNPLVWFAFHRIKADRELVCDALVLSHLEEQERKSYGHTLIKILESVTTPKSIPALVGILEVKSLLKQRISMITHYHTPPQSAAFAAVLLIILGFACLTDAQTQKTIDNTAPMSGGEQLNQRESSGISTNASSDQLINCNFQFDPNIILKNPEFKKLGPETQHLYFMNHGDDLQNRARKYFERKTLVNFGGYIPYSAPLGSSFQLKQEEIQKVNRTMAEQIIENGQVTNIEFFKKYSQSKINGFNEKYVHTTNVNISPTRPLFFNDRIGTIFVRATQGELTKVEKVLNTLNKEYGYTTNVLVSTNIPANSFRNRFFRVDPTTFLTRLGFQISGITNADGSVTMTNSVKSVDIVNYFRRITGINFGGNPTNDPNRSMFFNDRTGVLFVRATQEELDQVDDLLSILTATPAQICVDVRLIEIEQNETKALGFDWHLGQVKMDGGSMANPSGVAQISSNSVSLANPSGVFPGPGSTAVSDITSSSSANPSGVFPGPGGTAISAITSGVRGNSSGVFPGPAITTTGILTEDQFHIVDRALQQREGCRVIAAPKVITLSGRQTQLKTENLFSIDILPTLTLDEHTIKMEIKLEWHEKLASNSNTNLHKLMQCSSTVNVRDGQTVVLGGFVSEETSKKAYKNRMVFVTPIIIDPAGNRVHSSDK